MITDLDALRVRLAALAGTGANEAEVERISHEIRRILDDLRTLAAARRREGGG
jgi:hypothetical protein